MMRRILQSRRFEAVLALMLVGILSVSGIPLRAHQGSHPEIDGQGGDLETAAEDDDVTKIINQLNSQISRKKSEIDELKAQMKAYQRAIEQKREETVTIQSELAIVENKIAQTELDMASNKLEIETTNLEIRGIQAQIQDKTLKIMRQREMIGEFLRALHKTDQKTAVDLFLTEKTLSDFFNDVEFLQESERELKDAIDTVQALKSDLEQRATEEAAKKKHLEEIQKRLEEDKTLLSEQQNAKLTMAEQLRVSEVRYRYELAQLQKEVANINADIVASERKLRKTLDAERLRKISGGEGGWMWPVPSMIVTTYFHDPDYPFRYVFEHPGIDIRAPQSTPVRAAKGGYVARAKDAGMGYSYVMLVHDGELSTVYGHISKIVAQEDTYVEKGDIIAYSGGQPRTPGAGPLTTGPHLHFEIRLGGIPVNPLEYLAY